ncbi:MAG: hypothetical protein ABIG80_05325 [Patescibacteria group bacterium]
MNIFYDLLKVLHVISFVFMSVPLFNLIVVNERALFGSSFNYPVDRYMENIIKHGSNRCFVFQSSVFLTGILLLVFGPLGINALWANWIIAIKTILLFTLIGSLSYVHFKLQPKIEKMLANHSPDSPLPDSLFSVLKTYRAQRKRLATFCLFIVITIIILGLQVYGAFSPVLTIALIGLAGLFAWRVSKTLIRFGWI